MCLVWDDARLLWRGQCEKCQDWTEPFMRDRKDAVDQLKVHNWYRMIKAFPHNCHITLCDECWHEHLTSWQQVAKADVGKPRLSLVPSAIITAIARIREYGIAKYGSAEKWCEVEPARYRDAAYRHLLAYIDNPAGVDNESGLPHLHHLACNIAFLCAMEATHDT